MNICVYLGKRETANCLLKCTTIAKTIADGEHAYKFASPRDECNYIYPKLSLKDAIEAYERDTKWEGYAKILYYTYDKEIIAEFEELPPF